jgi:hypothetical protein
MATSRCAKVILKVTTPTEALAEIQVVRGAASLQYGTQFEVCKFSN